MQLLRLFPIIIALVFIIASSSNISFKSGNDVNPEINTKAPLIDSIHLYSDDGLAFSSLLQTISAQEQEQNEVNQGDNENASDSAMESEKGQDRGDGEKESSIGQEKEQQDSEEKQQDKEEIKEDCGPTERFDSETGSCITDQEKSCNDDSDNDTKVGSKDSDCLTNKNNQEQQDNKHQDKEKLLQEEDPSLDNKEDTNGGKNAVPSEEQNNSTSSDSHNTEDNTKNSSQNLTTSHSTAATTTSNNNTSLDEFHQYSNASAAEDGFTLNCHPAERKMLPGEEGSITCTIENKTPTPIELVLECSGLDGTGIECYINGEHPTERTLIKEMSYTNFSVLLVSGTLPPISAGSYPFTISAEDCMNSDMC